jgi:hypothetical protein
MFLDKSYILSLELAEHMGIRPGNFSQMHKNFAHRGLTPDSKKVGNCIFINKNSVMLPNNVYNGIIAHNDKLTDFSKMLPLDYFVKEFGVTKSQVLNLIGNEYFVDTHVICNKTFIEFSDCFIDTLKDTVVYTLSEKEKDECLENGDIDGSIELAKDKHLTWYKV